MSWCVGLFVDGASSLQVLAAEVSTLSGLALQSVNENDRETYQGYARDFVLIVSDDHGLENDMDMNFEDFPYQVNFWRNNIPDVMQAQANTLEFATTLFEKFKDAGRYRLMLVEDVQRKLASFG